MSVIAVERIFKPLFHFSFPKVAIKSRKAKKKKKIRRAAEGKRKRKGEKMEGGIRQKKKRKKSVKLNGESFNFKKVKASESTKEIYKNL